MSQRSAVSFPDLFRFSLYGVALLYVMHMSIVWIYCYPAGDLDDKAVHYYTAARLYASHAHAEAIRDAQPAWLTGSNSEQHARVTNRLASYANYPIPSSLLRLLLQLESPVSEGPPQSYTSALKKAFLILYIFGLLWIAALSWRDPFVMVFLLASLAIASLRVSLPWLPSNPPGHMLYLVYVPRGSAILLMVAAFAGFQQRRWWCVAATLFLLAGWHVGTAALVIPLMLLSFGITFVAEMPSRRIRLGLTGVLLLTGWTCGSATESSLPPTWLWIPLCLVCFLICLGRVRSDRPWLFGMTAASAYLSVCQMTILLLANPRLLDLLVEKTGNTLVAELPMRLSGSTQVAANILILVSIAWLARLACSRWMRPPRNAALFLALSVAVLTYVVYRQRDAEHYVAQMDAPFFCADDVSIPRKSLNTETLETLDPWGEATFFASLGDFLMYSDRIELTE